MNARSTTLHPYKAWLPAPLYWPYRAMRTAGVAFCFAVFWSGCVLVGWLWFPLLMLRPGTREQKIRRALRTVRRGFNLFHWTMHALRLYRRRSDVSVLRPHGAAKVGPAIIISNHPTLCDTTAIVSWFPDVVPVARTGFADNPLLRRAVRTCGFVPTGPHLFKDCEERLRMGLDVLVFPEGTRSPLDGTIHPFHRGAFEIAIRAKVPIVLVRLTCVPKALTKRLPIWKHPDRMAINTIEPFDIIDPLTMGLDSRALSALIEQRYRDMLSYGPATAAAPSPQALGDVQ